MQKTRGIVLSSIALLLVACLSWSGCGDDDDDDDNGADPNAVTIQGNVSSVNPVQVLRAEKRWLARLDSLVVSEAIAQGTCPATHTLICATNGRDPVV